MSTLLVGTPGNFSGNVHHIVLFADSNDVQVSGLWWPMLCPPGVTYPWLGTEFLCEMTGTTFYFTSNDYDFTLGPRQRYSTLNGIFDLTSSSTGGTVLSGVQVALRLTAQGDLTTERYTSEVVGSDGLLYLETETTTYASGPVVGTINGAEVGGMDGRSSIITLSMRRVR